MKSKVFDLIDQEKQRQTEGLVMIPSENYVSEGVLKALGSVLTNKYSEGYPGARYYSGNNVADQVEKYAGELAKKIFKVEYVNVQPYSGSPANLAVDLALCSPGDPILGMSLSSGGHLTHGAEPSFTSKIFKSVQYGVGRDGKIDLKEVKTLALKNKPKIIWVGGTAYPYLLRFKEFSEIAKKVGAYLIADISHVAGLVAGGVHPSPVKYVDLITTTTHKTLRGPRGAMIMVTKKGLKKDPELIKKIDKAVFPGLQGGPHMNNIAALAVALEEVNSKQWAGYSQQVVKNAKVLAKELGCKTDNHLILWDLSKYGFGIGYQMSLALEEVGIFVNKNTVPGEKAAPFYPSGIRLGTPAITSRDMKENEMKLISKWILEVLEEVKGSDLPQIQEERRLFIRSYKLKMKGNKKLQQIKKEVLEFANKFPVPGLNL